MVGACLLTHGGVGFVRGLPYVDRRTTDFLLRLLDYRFLSFFLDGMNRRRAPMFWPSVLR